VFPRIDNGHVLGVSAFSVPVIGAYAPLGLAPLIILAAMVAVANRRFRDRAWPNFSGFPAVICALAMIWSAVSVFWSIDPPAAHVSKLVRLAILLFAGFALLDCARALRPEERDRFQKLMLAGFALAAIMLLVDRAFEGPILRALPDINGHWTGVITQFNRGVTVLALMIWPVTLALWRRSPAQAIIGCLFALVLVSGFASTAAILAVAAGILCCALTFYLPRILPYFVAFGVLVAVFAGPFVSQHIAPPDDVALGELPIPNSAHHRLLIWRFTADKIGERPLLGWGFNSSKTIPGNTRSLGIGPPALPLHPHNVWLQWWLELGVVGAILGAVLIGGIAWRLREPNMARAERAISLALLVAAFLIGGVAYGAWQSWWIAAILFAVVFMAGSLNPPDQRHAELPPSQ